MTFIPVKTLADLKWNKLVHDFSKPIPTPKSFWSTGKYGAYLGGYADYTNTHSMSDKPGYSCSMETAPNF